MHAGHVRCAPFTFAHFDYTEKSMQISLSRESNVPTGRRTIANDSWEIAKMSNHT